MSKPMPLPFAAGMALCFASSAHASVSAGPPELLVSTFATGQPFPPVDQLTVFESDSTLTPGATLVLDAVQPGYGAPIAVELQSVTIGIERTITIRYRSLADAFVSQAAIDQLIPSDRFGLTFRLNLTDDEWDGGARTSVSSYLDDGQLIATDTRDVLIPSFSFALITILGDASPAGGGFLDSPGPIDEFVYTYSYTIVPAPGSASILCAVGLFAGSRRKR